MNHIIADLASDYLTVRQASKRIGVSEGLIYGWISSGRLACYRLGAAGRRGKIAIAANDLDALLARCRVEAGERKTPPPRRHRECFKHLRVS